MPSFVPLWLRGFAVSLLLLLAALSAQQVHVTPQRTAPRPPLAPPAATPALLAGPSAAEAPPADHPITVNVNLVLVPVSVLDPMDRPVTGLERQQFRLFENEAPQRIESFSSDDAPVSVGIVFDLSSSMSDKIQRSRQALREFLRTSNPQDQFFLVAFADHPQLISDFTSDIDEMEDRIALLQPNGRTALLDAIYLALAEMEQARYRRRALLVISDGGDNHSRYTEGEIRNVVRESDVQIFSIGIFSADMDRFSPEELAGPGLLSEISQSSGGREFTVDDVDQLPNVATNIGNALRNQYLLGYTPTDRTRNGKWRKIKVKLDPPPGLPRLTVTARSGYYAPRP